MEMKTKRRYCHYMQKIINLSAHPICIRESNGDFLICNHAFAETFLMNLKLTEWLSNLDFETSHKLCDLEIEAYSLELGLVIEENIIINGISWDFFITKLNVGNVAISIWQFTRIYRKIVLAKRFSSRIMETLTTIKAVVSDLNESQRNNLALYYLGASHSLISKILNISIGTSKNRIRNIQNKIPIDDKEEIFIIIHISGLSILFVKQITNLINKNVNNLLRKK
ncbi:conjugal transfer protein TraJ [Brenneria tiliae]|uniref:conjugal transfer protein TraJ n=1 Tax=Brenneria tiliae TaxID=2914984 RepID=UPI0020149B6D|nr:conjugal transfer protein TraJ [Brenneria tiliae]MCL2896805.1 conjugal transfer protein TraJ [Brenneria tiliae]MCL2901363.1 conjugal transfer protein TraJ [Brenneria tiliae]